MTGIDLLIATCGVQPWWLRFSARSRAGAKPNFTIHGGNVKAA